ncbi:MAG TPA: antitoxin MazE family protein [Stellaceae bacterium]|nr:antitoxin MazE family protein [Stellaceae bacterium]
MPSKPKDKMRAYRERLRRQGLRPVQLWLPDTRSSRFAAAARRQSRLVRDDPAEQETLDFIEAAMDTSGWR